MGFAKSLAIFLNGDAARMVDDQGRRVPDDSFYIMFNAHWEQLEFVLPESKWGEHWTLALDTNDVANHVEVDHTGRTLAAGERLHVHPWSLVVLRRLKSNGK